MLARQDILVILCSFNTQINIFDPFIESFNVFISVKCIENLPLLNFLRSLFLVRTITSTSATPMFHCRVT